MTFYTYTPSPIGQLLLTSDGENLTGVYMENHKGGVAVGSDWKRDSGSFVEVEKQLAAYFGSRLRDFDLPISLKGTEFQRLVWDLLLTIPFGQTVTYGDLAKRLGDPNASRAVGTAVGRNPISIIVPCHRVLGFGGAITGYAGGIDKKRILLDHESPRLL